MSPIQIEIEALKRDASIDIEQAQSMDSPEQVKQAVEEIERKLVVAIRAVKIKYFKYRDLDCISKRFPFNMNPN